MPMISRSTPASNGGRASIARSIGTSVVRRARSVMRCERGGDVLLVARLRPQRGDRAARLDHVRAREVDAPSRGCAPPPPAGSTGRALRRLQLHQDGGEALRQRVVDVARDAIALFEHRLAPLFEPALLGQPAVVQRQRRLTRHGVEQRAAPAPLAARNRGRRQRHPAEVARRQHQRRDEQRVDAGRGVERAHRLGQPRVVAGVLDDLGPARRVARAGARPCSRAATPATPSPARRGV